MSASVTVSICHATRCSSPARRRRWRGPSSVRCSGWMSSSTPHRTAGTARSMRAGRPFGGRSDADLGLDRDAAALAARRRARPRGATRAGADPSRRLERPAERRRTPAGRVSEAAFDRRRSSSGVTRPLVEQLVDDREVVERRGGRRRGRTPAGPTTATTMPSRALLAVDRPDAPSSGGSARRLAGGGGCRGGRRSAAATSAASAAGRASVPAVGPVTNPAGWAAHSTAQRCSSVDGATGDDEHALGDARRTSGVDEAS